MQIFAFCRCTYKGNMKPSTSMQEQTLSHLSGESMVSISSPQDVCEWRYANARSPPLLRVTETRATAGSPFLVVDSFAPLMPDNFDYDSSPLKRRASAVHKSPVLSFRPVKRPRLSTWHPEDLLATVYAKQRGLLRVISDSDTDSDTDDE